MTDAQRTWIGEAKAAFDQAYEAATTDRDYRTTPDFWVAQAQAAAAIETAEQAHLANLIAWKALQAARQTSSVDELSAGVDSISQEIEERLGLV